MQNDIFLSYDSADKERVRPLVELLESQGWTVWWDRKIPPGKTFAEVIYKALQPAKCILVVWSVNSVESKWVRKEAAEGDRRGILVPMLFDDVQVPFEFRDIHAAGLVGYPASTNETELQELLTAIESLVGKSARKPQPQKTEAPPRRPDFGVKQPTPVKQTAEADHGKRFLISLPLSHKNYRIAGWITGIFAVIIPVSGIILGGIEAYAEDFGFQFFISYIKIAIPATTLLIALNWPTNVVYVFFGVLGLHLITLLSLIILAPSVEYTVTGDDFTAIEIFSLLNATLAATICWWRIRRITRTSA